MWLPVSLPFHEERSYCVPNTKNCAKFVLVLHLFTMHIRR